MKKFGADRTDGSARRARQDKPYRLVPRNPGHDATRTPRKRERDRVMLDPTSVTETTLGGPDWAAIEAEYRAGEKSVRQIARDHGVSHVSIARKAKSQSWVRIDPKVQAILDKLKAENDCGPFPEQDYVADVVVGSSLERMAIYATPEGEIVLDFESNEEKNVVIAPGAVPAIIRRLRQIGTEIAANTINQLREIGED
jgi:hypothetical protein